MRETGKFLQFSAKSSSLVAVSDLSQPQHQTQTHTASSKSCLLSVFLPCLHLHFLYSSFCHDFSFIFFSPSVSFLVPYFLSFLWHCIQFLKYFSHLCPSVVLLIPPHNFPCASPTSTTTFFPFYLFPSPHSLHCSHSSHAHFVWTRGTNAYGLQIRSHLALFQGLSFILVLTRPLYWLHLQRCPGYVSSSMVVGIEHIYWPGFSKEILFSFQYFIKPCGLACTRPSTGKLENHHKDIKFPLICSSDTLYVQIGSWRHLKISGLQKIYLAVKLLKYTLAGSSVF